MRNLILFFTRQAHVFLFLLLEIICFYLIINSHNFQNVAYFNFVYEFTGSYYENYTNAVEYFRLKEVNDSLRAENARLRNQKDEVYYKLDSQSFDTIKDASFAMPSLITDTFTRDSLEYKRIQQYEYFPAKVINNSVSKRNNYITLNKGRKQGVEKRMGVTTDKGVAGIVKSVSPHFSVALSVLHNDFHLSCKIRETGKIGSLNWDGQDPQIVLLEDMPAYYDIKEGQEVVTSQYSSIFPEDIPVGEVVNYQAYEGDNFYTIEVKLYTDFRNLSEVYLIKNHMREEQIELEETAKE